MSRYWHQGQEELQQWELTVKAIVPHRNGLAHSALNDHILVKEQSTGRILSNEYSTPTHDSQRRWIACLLRFGLICRPD